MNRSTGRTTSSGDTGPSVLPKIGKGHMRDNKFSTRSIKVVSLRACLVLLMMFLILLNSQTASASTNQVPPSTVPAMPAQNAPIGVWQKWAEIQRALMQATNWKQVLVAPGCTVSKLNLNMVVSKGGYIPAGIGTDAVSVTGKCSTQVTPSTSPSPVSATSKTDAKPSSSTLASSSSPYCPYMDSYSPANVTSGVACVGTTTVNGNPNYMAAAYTFTASSGSSYGHADLGTTSGSCIAENLIASETPEQTLTPYSFGEVIWGPRSFTAEWTSTWWQDNGGGNYTDFGTACGSY